MPRITIENLSFYLSNGENETIEFKRSVPQKLDSIGRIISAFANTKGGSIIFGYDEQKKAIVGINTAHAEKLRAMCEQSQYRNICMVYSVQDGDKTLAILEVGKAKTDLYVKNVAYIRSGDRIFIKVGNIRSKYLKEFIEEIQFRNRNPQDIKVLELLDDLSTNPERRIPVGTHLYRCRIMPDISKAGKENGFFGYGKSDSFVPPPNVTRDLRANYRYIPYLYCANHPYTALVEVRPRLGANVSVATITTNAELTLLDFTLKDIPKRMTDTKLRLFADLSMLYSKPVTSEDDILDYIPTQFVAEYAKRLGYDGIAFRSSLTPELEDQDVHMYQDLDRYNIVVFNYSKCEATASNIVNVTRNYLECEQIDQDTHRVDIHTTILDMRF